MKIEDGIHKGMQMFPKNRIKYIYKDEGIIRYKSCDTWSIADGQVECWNLVYDNNIFNEKPIDEILVFKRDVSLFSYISQEG